MQGLQKFWALCKSVCKHTQETRDEFVVPLLICWFIWRHRNELDFKVLNLIFRQSTRRYSYTSNLLPRFGIIPSSLGRSPSNLVQVTWSKPPQNWFKLNIDRASKINPGAPGIGDIIRNYLGEPMGGYLQDIGNQSNTYAKLKAVLHGLALYQELKLFRIWIEIDSHMAIRFISQQLERRQIQHILAKIQQSLHCVECKISHFFCEGNSVANRLVHLVVEWKASYVFHSIVPPKINGLLRLDKLLVSILCLRTKFNG